MQKTRNCLLAQLIAAVVVALAVVILSETAAIDLTVWAGSASTEFVLATAMELLTLLFIYLSLRLFRFKAVHERLVKGRAGALLGWGSLRMVMLCLPLVANTLLYYIYLNTAFGYMAIILALCLVMVFPTIDRCNAEVEGGDEAEKQQE